MGVHTKGWGHDMRQQSIRVLIADDHAILRYGLRMLLEGKSSCEVVAETGDGLEAIRLAVRYEPDLVILDISMPGMRGIEVCREIRSIQPRTRILFLTQHSGEEYIFEAFANGAQGYVVKDGGQSEVVAAVGAVSRGERFLSRSLRDAISQGYLRRACISGEEFSTEVLTPRQREVLILLSQGKTSREIAGQLYISKRTVDHHRQNLMQRLGVRNTAQALRYAFQHALIQS